MYGDVECDDLVSVFQIFIKNRKSLSDMSTSLSWLATLPQTLTQYRFLNTISNSRSNISAHYDISNEMFAGFLSEDMTYSCGIFPDLDADLIDHSPSRRRHLRTITSSPDVSDKIDSNANRWSNALIAAAVEQQSKKLSSNSADQPKFTIVPTIINVSGMTTPEDETDQQRPPEDADPEAEMTDSEHTFAASTTPASVASSSSSDKKEKDELYEAQMRKIHHIIRKADIRPGHRVLEIGSGWGALAIEAVRLTGCTVDTLTLSIAQKVLAEERIAAAGAEYVDKIRVHLMDYRAMPKEWEGTFDRFVSVEMIEAVGREFLEGYWGVVDWALKKEDSMGVVQVITIPEASECLLVVSRVLGLIV